MENDDEVRMGKKWNEMETKTEYWMRKRYDKKKSAMGIMRMV